MIPLLLILLIPSTLAQYTKEDDTRCGAYGEWWIYHRNQESGAENCYQFLNNQPPATWESARNECQTDFEADLLNIDQELDEMRFITGKLNHWTNTTYKHSNTLDEVWTGIQRKVINGEVVWEWNKNIVKVSDLPLSTEAKTIKSDATKCVILRSENHVFHDDLYLRDCDVQLKNYICKKNAHAPRPRTVEED